MTLAIAFAVTAIVFLGLDAIWISQMTPMYREAWGDNMRTSLDLVAAAGFYLIYVAGLTYFAVAPGAKAASLGQAALNGALLGLVAYATYDLTNQATFTFWRWRITLMDIAWGAILSASASAAGCWAAMTFGKS